MTDPTPSPNPTPQDAAEVLHSARLVRHWAAGKMDPRFDETYVRGIAKHVFAVLDELERLRLRLAAWKQLSKAQNGMFEAFSGRAGHGDVWGRRSVIMALDSVTQARTELERLEGLEDAD
jgi:hypothetical protein